MIKVVFFYQHISREFRAYQRIGREMNRIAPDGALCGIFSLDFEWITAYVWAKRHGIDVLAMPWIRHEYHQAYIEPFLKINPDLTVVNLDQEQIGSPLSMKVVLPACEYARNGALHLAWSDFFKESLLADGVREDLVRVVGNARLDLLSETKMSREALASEFGLDMKKKWLLFAETRGGASRRFSQDVAEQLACGITEEDMKLRDAYLEESLTALEVQLKNLPKTFFDNYEFIYRTHPGQDLAITIPQRVRAIPSYSIGEWLAHVDAFLTFGSTSAFEADRAGVPVLVHTPIERRGRFTVYGLLDYTCFDEIGHLTDDLIDAARSKQLNGRIYERYMGRADCSSSLRTAQAILDETCRSGGRPMDPQPFRAELKRKLRYEVKVWLAVKTGLMQRKYRERWNEGVFIDIPYRKDSLLNTKEYADVSD